MYNNFSDFHQPSAQGATSSLRHAAAKQLALLTSSGQSRPLQESTIVAIAVAVTFEGTFDRATFWGRPDTCSRSTYNKWKKYDAAFVSVLEAVVQLAREWRSDYALTAMEEAITRLQLATPDAADTLIQVMTYGEYAQRRMAAKDVLNHLTMQKPRS